MKILKADVSSSLNLKLEEISMKKCISFILATAMLLCAFTSCGSNTGTASSDATPVNSGSTTAKPVTFRFQWWGSDTRHEATLEVIKKYMAENPHVTIEAEYRGKSEREKVATELAGGQLADLVQLDYNWLSDFTSTGDFFVDLNTLSEIVDTSGFDMEFVNSYAEFGNKLIALPTGVNARANLINKTVAAEYDIPTSLDTKWTWEDYLNIGKTVNAKDAEKYFLNADSNTISYYVLVPYLAQLTGKQIVQDDYSLGFTNDELANALAYIGSLYKEKVVLPASEANVFLSNPWTNPKWINGDFVSELTLTSTMPTELADMPGDGAAFIIPQMEDAKGTGITVQPSQLLGISKNSDCIEEVAKFMNYFFNSEEAGLILKDCRSIPPVEKIRQACSDKGFLNQILVDATDYAMKNKGANHNNNSGNSEVEEILKSACEKIAYAPDDSLKIANETIAQLNNITAAMKTK